MCTMHVWTIACGYTDSIASGNPFRPVHAWTSSTFAISTSRSPRAFSSFITAYQNRAPSVCSIHSPSTSLRPAHVTPIPRYTALFRIRPSSRTFARIASKYTTA